jgi:hypothetical protein
MIRTAEQRGDDDAPQSCVWCGGSLATVRQPIDGELYCSALDPGPAYCSPHCVASAATSALGRCTALLAVHELLMIDFRMPGLPSVASIHYPVDGIDLAATPPPADLSGGDPMD